MIRRDDTLGVHYSAANHIMKSTLCFIPMIAAALVACSAPTEEAFVSTPSARLEGRITLANGQPGDSALVAVRIDQTNVLYSAAIAYADKNGDYSVDIHGLRITPGPDTSQVKAFVTIGVLKAGASPVPPEQRRTAYRDSVIVTVSQPAPRPIVTRFDYKVPAQ